MTHLLWDPMVKKGGATVFVSSVCIWTVYGEGSKPVYVQDNPHIGNIRIMQARQPKCVFELQCISACSRGCNSFDDGKTTDNLGQAAL